MANKLKAGIIGCGGIANGKHMPSIKAAGRDRAGRLLRSDY